MDLTYPNGHPRRLLPVATPATEPIPVMDPVPTPHEPMPVAVKASETCGPCGSTFALEWVGRLETLTAIRDWRRNHRCEPPVPDNAGTKAAHVERAGFGPD